ncbi:hypothetical protein [Microbulbifer thermotolerans]|uniref:hypothetical protein n=1 Tax=Microbulbifer thermotolerans TaxID=252514 RepID=UPI00224B2B53|nr:hypothetical protein [Microbulbifer thermotolerans]MCX2834481.1 hypothetical protein [Microbulbifer thermotolerans]
MNQRALRLCHRVTEVQVFHAWLNNSAINTACNWDSVVRDELIFGCLAREAAYTHRGQRPRKYSPLEGNTMEKNLVVLDMAQARQIRLALALCRERIACPATTTVAKEEAVRELRAAQEIFLEHEERAAQLQALNREL